MGSTLPLSQTEEDAFAFIQAAADISRAKEMSDEAALISALDENLRLWVLVRTLVAKKEKVISSDLQEKFLQLSTFVIKKTFEYGENKSEEILETFMNINLQIAEGLLENAMLSTLEEDAFALIKSSYALSLALEKNDSLLMSEALNNNLKLWVAIKTLVKSPNNDLPDSIKDNLNTLSEFVIKKTFELSKEVNAATINSLVNTNLQIAEGLLESRPLSIGEEDAFALLKSAMTLSNAKASGNDSELVSALDDNLKLWVEIRTLVSKASHPMPQDIKDNLILLADFTAQKTFEYNGSMNVKTLDTLINTNLQICEGLLERMQAS
ncbi:MAG: hypothetical protein IKD08_03645 [Alphaproteobacteria bacterium]|nr:hypothetical protein [Alphaproteobacteria bacterium]